MGPSELVDLYSRLRITDVTSATGEAAGSCQWAILKKCLKVVAQKLFDMEPACTVQVLEQTLREFQLKLAPYSGGRAPSKGAKRRNGPPVYVGCKANLKNVKLAKRN